jgi:hypothetical protein
VLLWSSLGSAITKPQKKEGFNMQETKRIMAIFGFAAAFCFVIASMAQAQGSILPKKPTWQITTDGIYSVIWKTNKPNPRFAIYNSGTPGDTTDDMILDKETSLVWERSPDTTTTSDWGAAVTHCYQSEIGGRKGWRLPTIEELSSLISTINSNPALPSGHPFSIVTPGFYWSATTCIATGCTNHAWRVGIHDGAVGAEIKTDADFRAWCVRGGHGYDGY